MYLVISEKPSVAQSIAKVIGAYRKENGYLEGHDCIVSWCLGHLAEYAMPEAYDERYRSWNFSDLPIIPDQWKLDVPKDKKGQFTVLKKLLCRNDLEYVVNACDAGREGELIFKRVYDLSGSRLPVKRLWISSMEDTAIMDGFADLKDGEEYKNLADASVCRAQADWLIGMNATRAFTKTYDYRLTVGRVQTPTLAMLAERDEQIHSFEKKPYYVAHLLLDTSAGRIDAVSGHIPEREDANRVTGFCNGETAFVTSLEREAKHIAPPRLYDLTTLQREANRMFGYTASKTLDYAQSLYENKLITYPRTDSQYLTDDMEVAAANTILAVCEIPPFANEKLSVPDIHRLLNSKKVSDHHAIIPTVEIKKKNLQELSEGERNILLLIAFRLLCASGEKHIYETVKASFQCCGYSFLANGKAVKEQGWKRFETALRSYCRLSSDETGDAEDTKSQGDMQALESLFKGARLSPVSTKVTEHFTQPPKPYTEDSLLAAMERAGSSDMEDEVERKGLGTPATRASIIEKLIASGYAARKKKQILVTEAGTKMIALMPDYLKSPKLTADWENRLLAMEWGQVSSDVFMSDIYSMIDRMLTECRNIPETERQKFAGSKEDTRKQIGKCPVCGSPVYEGKKNFYCGSRDCSFAIWIENRYLSSMKKKIDKKMAADLLSKGKTHCSDLYSAKTGKEFEADLLMEVSDDGKTSFKLEFPKRTSGKRNDK